MTLEKSDGLAQGKNRRMSRGLRGRAPFSRHVRFPPKVLVGMIKSGIGETARYAAVAVANLIHGSETRKDALMQDKSGVKQTDDPKEVNKQF